MIHYRGAENQSLVPVPKVPGLIPKSLLSACSVKIYVLLIVIRKSYGDFEPSSFAGAFNKSRLMPASGFA